MDNWSVKIWEYEDAPQDLVSLAPSFGGDEDYLIVGNEFYLVNNIANHLAICDYELTELDDMILATTCHS